MQKMQVASFALFEWKGVVGTLPGIEPQGSYSAVTRYSTSNSLFVNRSITSTHAQRAIPGNRIVATVGPYECYVAIPLTHLYQFKARMRLHSCGLLCMCGSRKIYVNAGR